MSLKVLLLAKPYPLSFHLEQRIERAGCELLTIYEQPRSAYRCARAMARRLGLLKTADILAYSLYERIFRRREIRACMKKFPKEPCAAARDAAAAPQTRNRIFTGDANSEETRRAIARFAPDVMVVHATGILKAETFRPAKVAVNLHVGILPKYRGHDSTFWALESGDLENVGATLHVIDAGVDTGEAIGAERVAVLPEDTDVTAWVKAFEAGTELVLRFLRCIEPANPAPDAAAKRIVRRAAAGPAPVVSRHWPRRGLSDYWLAKSRARGRAAARGTAAGAAEIARIPASRNAARASLTGNSSASETRA